MIKWQFLVMISLMVNYQIIAQKISPDSLMALGEIYLPFDSVQLSVFDNPNNTGGCYRFYQNGVLVMFKCFYNSNNIKSEVQFDSRERETGMHRMWYDSGQLSSCVERVAGKYHGTFQAWDSTGVLISDGTLKRGRGIIDHFNTKGEVYQRDFLHQKSFICSIIYRKQGVCPDGKIEYDSDFRKNKEHYIRYDCETRNIIEKGIMSFGAKDGLWEYFDKNGILVEKRLYKYGELIEKEVVEK